jgi:protein-disulfide isomerase
VNSTPTVFLDGELFTDYTTPDDLAANLVEAVS